MAVSVRDLDVSIELRQQHVAYSEDLACSCQSFSKLSTVCQEELLPDGDLHEMAEHGINMGEAAEDFMNHAEEPAIEELLEGAPVDPVAPDVPPPPEVPRERQGPDDRVYLDVGGGGRLVYYKTRQEFYAECPLRGTGHQRNCRRSRTSRSSENMRRPGQGRPLGLLLAWLESAEQHDTSDSHKVLFHTTHEDRKNARQFLKTLPGSDALFEYERHLEPGEDSEPEQEP